LKEEGTYNPLDLTSIVNISTLFPEGVELVKKQDARTSDDMLKEFVESARSLAQKTPDNAFISNGQEDNPKCLRQAFGKTSLSISRGAD